MKQYLGTKPVTMMAYESYKINNSEIIAATANAAIQVGDSAYIIDNNVYLATNGEFTNLPMGTKLGYAMNSANVGDAVRIKTIGEVAVDYDVSDALAAQDALIAQINEVLNV